MSLIATICRKFPDVTTDPLGHSADPALIVDGAGLFNVLQFLRDDEECLFNLFLDLCGVDYLGSEPRFEVVYHLYSLSHKNRIRVRTRVSETNLWVPSVIELWAAADWFEREAYDMFGIKFSGHPNLKRLLMWEEFVGHPLRKDYPINKRQPIPKPLDIV